MTGNSMRKGRNIRGMEVEVKGKRLHASYAHIRNLIQKYDILF